MKRALITGINGQDGSYLAELLLRKGYEVHGIVRRASTINTARLDAIYQDPHESGRRLFLHYGDMVDGSGLARLIREIAPDEIYNLAAQSHVAVSFEQPVYTADVVALGTLRLIEAIRNTGCDARVYQASSSEMFGNAPAPQHEGTPFNPASPYAAAKVFAHHAAVNARDAHGLFISCGILFNHESPRRDVRFVTRKVTHGLAQIAAGSQKRLYLGNLDAVRDWGYAPEYVEAMWLMLQADEPDDYVIATGQSCSVREWVERCACWFGMQPVWNGAGVGEQCIDNETGRVIVEVDPAYYRPVEVDSLRGDCIKAYAALGWRWETDYMGLAEIMVAAEKEAMRCQSSKSRTVTVC